MFNVHYPYVRSLRVHNDSSEQIITSIFFHRNHMPITAPKSCTPTVTVGASLRCRSIHTQTGFRQRTIRPYQKLFRPVPSIAGPSI
jgi:hypothetical protein